MEALAARPSSGAPQLLHWRSIAARLSAGIAAGWAPSRDEHRGDPMIHRSGRRDRDRSVRAFDPRNLAGFAGGTRLALRDGMRLPRLALAALLLAATGCSAGGDLDRED